MKRLNPNVQHIGLVRYADDYHPTNEQSQARWLDLMTKLDELRFRERVPRVMVRPIAKCARALGYQIHLFEKGLGR